MDGGAGFLTRILPHGLLEIPTMLLVTAVSVQAGYRLYSAPWPQKRFFLQQGFRDMALAWGLLALCLLPAALLEGFGRGWISGLF